MRPGAEMALSAQFLPEGQMFLVHRRSVTFLRTARRVVIAALTAAAATQAAHAAQVAPPAAPPLMPLATPATDQAWRRIVEGDDHRGLPFAIVDKQQAVLSVFDGRGRQIARTPVLLGLAPGDDSTPGVGQRAQVGAVAPQERTTPAGRFEAEPGRNVNGEDIVWLDYEAALAIHRLRPGPSKQAREQRLSSPRLADRRVSLGCVVVPVAFYQSVIAPVLGRSRSVVYVLPETRPLATLFAQLSQPMRTASR